MVLYNAVMEKAVIAGEQPIGEMEYSVGNEERRDDVYGVVEMGEQHDSPEKNG